MVAVEIPRRAFNIAAHFTIRHKVEKVCEGQFGNKLFLVRGVAFC